jgi:broad specificity phosphatase PhoE
MNFYIFRHGETFQTKHDVHYGSKIETAEILPEGIPAIKRVANYLKDKTSNKKGEYFSSPYLRCKQTVEIVKKIVNKKFKFEKYLGEYREDKETFGEFASRIDNFLKELKNVKIQNVTICTHGGVMAGLKHFILNGKFEEIDLYDFPKPGVLLEMKNGKMNRIDFN